jgi:tripartite-type tricarboxylate transporter receptor subunit TctC
MEEAGVPGYEITIWSGVFAPKGTPAAVIDELNKTITAASRDLADRFSALGGRPMPMTPTQLGALLDEQIALWRKVISQANVHVD